MKMRIPGLGGRVYAKYGTSVVLLPPGEIYTALERGVIDATEWVGPHDDMKMGFHQAARNYYYPGWHEPGTTGEFVFNKKAYDALPVDFQRMLDYITQALNTVSSSWSTSRGTRRRSRSSRPSSRARWTSSSSRTG